MKICIILSYSFYIFQESNKPHNIRMAHSGKDAHLFFNESFLFDLMVSDFPFINNFDGDWSLQTFVETIVDFCKRPLPQTVSEFEFCSDVFPVEIVSPNYCGFFLDLHSGGALFGNTFPFLQFQSLRKPVMILSART